MIKEREYMLRKIVLVFVISVLTAAVLYGGEGEIGKDDFITSTISDVFNKVGQYTSGEKTLLDPVDSDDRRGNYSQKDVLGREIEDPAIKPLRRPSSAEE
ncbi:MAG: hypothetical protein KBB52_06265 [Candidatus Omnitrophica bacterium]|nr:hypothetical protein [Candidatus Omnitrophota bacterium]